MSFTTWLRLPKNSYRSLRRGRRTRKTANQLRRAQLTLELLEDRALLSTFEVINVNDSGAGSLREAIELANVHPNVIGRGDLTIETPDLITFNIPNEFFLGNAIVQTISPASALPVISDPVIIDGYSQPGASVNTLATGSNAVLLIRLSGANAGGGADALRISGGGSTVRGLVINGFDGDGIEIITNGGNFIAGNFIGINAAGNAVAPNGNPFVEDAGVFINDTPNNTIGGTTPEHRNVLTGNNSHGVWIREDSSTARTATDNVVQGNIIGLAADADAVLTDSQGFRGNRSGGVWLDGAANNLVGGVTGVTVGGAATGAANVISGNSGTGVRINNAIGNRVEGNVLGLNGTGTDIRSNSRGVALSGSSMTTIGGTSVEQRNIISGNGGGIWVDAGSNNNRVQGNYIGTDVSGTLSRGNGGVGGIFLNGNNNTIGGATTTPGTVPGNLISGNNGHGIRMEGGGQSNQVLGNIIGLNSSGSTSLGNSGHGVSISGGFTLVTVGGTAAGSRNIISANNVGIDVAGASDNTIQGNYIGTDITGTLDRGNSTGIFLNSSNNNLIGGTTPTARNVISGNGYTYEGGRGASGGGGIGITSFSTGTVIQGNYLGVQTNGVSPLGNVGHGIFLERANNTLIGGTAGGAANIIAFSGNDSSVPGGGSFLFHNGVSLVQGSGNAILGNSIHNNTGLGIDLVSDGVTANDVGDVDLGLFGGSTNNLQNFPVLSFVSSNASSTTIIGSLNSTPNTTFRVEFYSNTAPDPSGFGEGTTFIGFTAATTDGAGNVNFTLTLPVPVPVAEFVTATASDPANSTSEFSGNRVVVARDQPPVAEAGGPYEVVAHGAVELDASGTTDVDQLNTTLTYQWDLDGDGVYGETGADAVRGNETGMKPTFLAPDLHSMTSITVGLLVTDNTGRTGTDTATVRIVACTPVPPGAVSWWRAEDNAADTVDLNHGTLQNGATFTAGRVGQAFSFDGVNDFVSLSEAELNPASITVDAWVKLGTTQRSTIFLAKFGFPPARGWGLGISDSSDNVVKWFTGTNTGNQDTLFSTTKLQNNVWHHVAATFDGTTKRLYVNGVLEASQTWANAIGYDNTVSSIGNLRATGTQFFNGQLDEVDVFNRSLSGAEIQAIFDAGLAGKCANQPPVVVADSYSVNEDAMLTVAAPGVLANDSDHDGNPITAVLVAGPASGTLTLNANGSFTYVHNGSETTSDGFTYLAFDGTADSSVVTVSITVTPVNDPPVADNDGPYIVAEGGTLDVSPATGVLDGDTDVDSVTLKAVLVGTPTHATSFTLNNAGSFTYVHDGSETTSDSFTYQASDGTALSNVATVLITITPVNDPPVISDMPDQTITENHSSGAIAFNVGDLETSVDALIVTASSSNTSLVPGANLVFGGAGADRTLTVTPATNQTGTATITVSVADADGGTSSGSFLLTVAPNNGSGIDADFIVDQLLNGFALLQTNYSELARLIDPNANTGSPLLGDLPLISSADFTNAIDIQHRLAALGFPSLDCTNCASESIKTQLEQAGFEVSYIIPDAELVAGPAAGANLLTATKSVLLSRQIPVGSLNLASALGIISIADESLMGSLAGSADLLLNLTIGVDTAGAYFGPSTSLSLDVDLAGSLLANIPLLTASAEGALNVDSHITLATADSRGDGRVHLDEFSDRLSQVPLDVSGTADLDVFGSLSALDVQVSGDFQWQFANSAPVLDHTLFTLLVDASFFSGQVAVTDVVGTFDGSVAIISSGVVTLPAAIFGPDAKAAVSSPIVIQEGSLTSGQVVFSEFDLPVVGGLQLHIDSATLNLSAGANFDLEQVSGRLEASGVGIDFNGQLESDGDYDLAATADRFQLGQVNVDLEGTLTRTAGVIDYSLLAQISGTVVAGLSIVSPSTMTLTKADGLEIDALADAFGVKLDLLGALTPSGDFVIDVTADRIQLGQVNVDLEGTLTRTAGVIDYSLLAQISGTVVAGLNLEAPSTVTLAKDEGLEIDARADAFGVKLDLLGALTPSGDFAIDVTADHFQLGQVNVDLEGALTRTAGVIDYSLLAEVSGTIVAGLTIEPSSRARLTKAQGLELDAQASAFGLEIDIDGQFQAGGNFSLAAASQFPLGETLVTLGGTVFKDDSGSGWSLMTTVANFNVTDFLTIDELLVTLDAAGIGFQTTTTIAGLDDIQLAGDYHFGTKTYLLTATVPLDEWKPISGVNVSLSNVIFSITNRNSDDSLGATRVRASAETSLFGTDFLVVAYVTSGSSEAGSGFWLAATPQNAWQPVPLLTVEDAFIVASSYDFVLDLDEVTEVTPRPNELSANQRQVFRGINLLATSSLSEDLPGVLGGSQVQIAGLLGESLSDLFIEAKVVLTQPWVLEIAQREIVQFQAFGLRITGVPSLELFGDGRVLGAGVGDGRAANVGIPNLGQDILVRAELELGTTDLTGSLSLIPGTRVENVFGIEGLNIVSANIGVGIAFGTPSPPPPKVEFGFAVETPQTARSLGVPGIVGAALVVDPTKPVMALTVKNWYPFTKLGIDEIFVEEGTIAVAPLGGTLGTRTLDPGMTAIFDANIFGTSVSFVGVLNQLTSETTVEAYVSSLEIAGVGITGNGPDGVYEDGLVSGPEDADADNGAYFRGVLKLTEPSLTFSGRLDLPGEDSTGRPAFAQILGTFSPQGVLLKTDIHDWRLVPGVLEIDDADFSLDISFADPAAASLEFSADFELLGTPIEADGKLNRQGIRMATTVRDNFTLGGVGVEEFVFSFSTFAEEEHLYFRFVLDLPGQGGEVQMEGRFEEDNLRLAGTIDQWHPLGASVDFNGSLDATIGLATTSLVLNFDVHAILLGSRADFAGELSAAPGGFDLYATGAIALAFPGGQRVATLAATIDIGKNSPFAIALAADFRLPGYRPADVRLVGSLDVARGVELFADVNHWQLVPALSFGGTLDVGVDIAGSNLAVMIDVNANMLGANLNLSGSLLAGAGQFDLNLHGHVDLGGKQTNFVNVSLDADLVTTSTEGVRTFGLALSGDVSVFGNSFSATAEFVGASDGTWLLETTVAIEKNDGGPIEVLHAPLGLFDLFVAFQAEAHLTIGSDVSDFAASIGGEITTTARMNVDAPFSDPSYTFDFDIGIAAGKFTITDASFEIITKEMCLGSIGGVKFGCIDVPVEFNRIAHEFGWGVEVSPTTTVTTDLFRLDRDQPAILRIRGTEANERIRVSRVDFPPGIFDPGMVRVEGATGDGEWVTLRVALISDIDWIDVDAGAGNDQIEVSSAIGIPTVLRGGLGADVVRGGSGPNTIYGGTGPVTPDPSPPPVFPRGISPRDGVDQLFGGSGIDRIFGEDDNDLLVGGSGADLLDGGAGVNLINGSISMLGTRHDDHLQFTLEGQSIVIRSFNRQGAAVTLARLPAAEVTSLEVDGGEGDDLIEINSLITLPTMLRGGAGDDIIVGGNGLNTIYGGSGNDILAGGLNNDGLFGEDGHDLIDGRGGNDTIDPGPGQLVSQPPLVSQIADIHIDEDQNTGVVPFTVTNVDGSQTDWFARLTSFNTALILDAGIVLSGSGANRTFALTPTADQFGAATIMIAIGDGTTTAAIRVFTVAVNPVNDQPNFFAVDPPPVNETLTLASLGGLRVVRNWAAFVPGPENESEQMGSYSVSGVSNPGLFAILPSVSSDGTLLYKPALNSYGTSTFVVIATDNGGRAGGGQDTSRSRTFTITVNHTTTAWVSRTSGFWDDASNWSTGTVPTAGERVMIDLPNTDITVTYRGGDLVIGSLESKESLIFLDGSLSLAESSSIDNLVLSAGTIGIQRGVLSIGGGSSSGAFQVPATAEIRFTGDFDLNTATRISGGGLARIAPTGSTGQVLAIGDVQVSSLQIELDGTLSVSGSLTATSSVSIQGGTLSGTGRISGSVMNAGSVRPGRSPGVLTIDGDYEQTPYGVLEIEIGGPNVGTDFDQLVILGSALLGGALDVNLVNGFTPVIGQRFSFVESNASSGSFVWIFGDFLLNQSDGDMSLVFLPDGGINNPPSADAGESYTVAEGGSVELDGSGSSDAQQLPETLDYQWDLDGDGIFGEIGMNASRGNEIGISPTFSAAGLDGPGDVAVSLRVTDDLSETHSNTAVIHVNNVQPTLTSVVSAAPEVCGNSADRHATISGAFTDPGLPDTHTVLVNWGDGSSVESVSVDQLVDTFSGSHTYATGGIFTVTVTAIDDDGGVSNSWTTTAVAQGVGLVEGVLYIIGTDGRDHVDLKFNKKKDELKVEIKFDQGSSGGGNIKQIYQASSINRFVTYLFGGDDHYNGGNDGGSDGDSATAIPQFVIGSAGDDHISGGRGSDALSGGSGDDDLRGGVGWDILIGGRGKDKLQGGNGNDLLIGGSVSREDDLASLDAALADWSRGDLFAAEFDLGTLTDDGDRDDLNGEEGDDQLTGGIGDKLMS